MLLSVAIQHHPSRAKIIPALVNALEPDRNLQHLIEIVGDPDPDGVPSPWRCYRECLARTPADATHRLILQDDVLVCPGFTDAVRAAVAARPDRMLAFFVGSQSYEHAQNVYGAAGRGESWAQLGTQTWVPVVALLWPARLARELPPWADAKFESEWPLDVRADDAVAGHFLRERGESVLASVPSLVQHPDVIASIIHGRGFDGNLPDRQAACWIADCDVTTIDWSLGAA